MSLTISNPSFSLISNEYRTGENTLTEEEEREILRLANILLKLAKHKKKRQRTSPDQLAVLEKIFKGNHTPDQETRQRLSKELGMTSRRIQIWFQNKRAKIKKSHNVGKDDSSLDEDEDEEEDDEEEELVESSSPESYVIPKENYMVLPSLSQIHNVTLDPNLNLSPLPRFWV